MSERVFELTPVPKPRMTKRDKWQQRPAVLRYRAFCDEARLRGLAVPVAGAHLRFVLPMPASWSAHRRQAMLGQPHTQVPDVDNLLKAVLDALYDNDSGVHDIRISKVWGTRGLIIVDEPDG